MTLPEVHLAGEAVAALIDGELSRGAYHRALDHMVRCPECRTAVNAQRQAKDVLVGTGIPAVPNGLLSRLHAVPMTTDLGGPRSGILAVSDGDLVWTPIDLSGAPAAAAPPGTASPVTQRGPRTHRRHGPSRPRSYPVNRVRSVRLRRGLAGTLAGLAFGVVAAAAPIGSSGVSLQQPGVVNRGPQVVPAGVGFGINLGPRREGSTTAVDRSVRTTSAPGVDVGAIVRSAVVSPR